MSTSAEGSILKQFLRALMLLLSVASVHAVVLASTTSDFAKIWSARDASYRSERPVLEEAAQRTAAVLVATIKNKNDFEPPEMIAALTSARQLSELLGRGAFLYEFREHMKTKPSAAVSEAWMQERVSALKTLSIAADDYEAQVRAMQPGKNVSFVDWVGALEKLVMMRGDLNGRVQEMTLVDQNLDSYYAAKRQADARRRDFLRAFGQALATQQRSVQNWSAFCTTNGRNTTCLGN